MEEGDIMRFFEVEEHTLLNPFYEKNGLEVSENIVTDDGAVLSVAAQSEGNTVAAGTLSKRHGVFILDYIAVEPCFRMHGLGGEILSEILRKAGCMGAEAVYITARRPSFFKKHGFKEGSPKGIDMNEGCIGCPQYNTTCVSVPMYLKLGENL